MRCRIHTVGCKSDLDKGICSKSEIILGRSSHYSIRIKYHDAVMRLTDAKFILSAYHTE